MKQLFAFDVGGAPGLKVNYSGTLVYEIAREHVDHVDDVELGQPGVYILISDGLIYVGQSGVSVRSRLRAHLKEKTWWKKVIVITDEYGKLEKTYTEYMEAYFIQELTKRGVPLDNENYGNTVITNEFTKLRVAPYIENALAVIDTILRSPLSTKKTSADREEAPTHGRILLTYEGKEIIESTPVKALHAFLVDMMAQPASYVALYNEVTMVPSADSPLTMASGNSADELLLVKGDMYLWKKLSGRQAIKLINYYAEILSIDIEIKGVDSK